VLWPLLCSGSRADDPYLIYGDDDHLVVVVSENLTHVLVIRGPGSNGGSRSY
jgi:hypothetical protein